MGLHRLLHVSTVNSIEWIRSNHYDVCVGNSQRLRNMPTELITVNKFPSEITLYPVKEDFSSRIPRLIIRLSNSIDKYNGVKKSRCMITLGD